MTNQSQTEKIDPVIAKQDFFDEINTLKKQVNGLSKKLDELYYGNLLHDSINDSAWLKNKSFSLYGWAANYSFIYLLFRILDKTNPQNILEMGLGQTTKVTSQYIAHKNPSAFLTVCEHNQEWIDIYKTELPQNERIRIHHLALEIFEYEGQQNDKYKNLAPLVQNQKFDLILIDGPTGGGKTFPRSNIIDLVKNNHLADDFVIIFDDAERPGEKLTIEKTKEELKQQNREFCCFERSALKNQYLIISKSKSFITFL